MAVFFASCFQRTRNTMKVCEVLSFQFVVRLQSFFEAIKKVETELLEIYLKLEGAENFYDERYFYGVPSKEMADLIDKLEMYPVQFKNVHYFPPDG